MIRISTTPGYVGALVTGHIEPPQRAARSVTVPYEFVEGVARSRGVLVHASALAAWADQLLRDADGVSVVHPEVSRTHSPIPKEGDGS